MGAMNMAYLGNTIVGGSLRVINGLYVNTITGNGSGLTSLNASNISSGTLAAARLATSGATAGSYGPSAAITGSNGTTMNVPYITVDTYGRVTAISNKVYTSKDTVYTHPSDGANTGSFGPSANASPAHGAGFSVPYITVNAAGHVTAASTKTITLPAQYSHPTSAGNIHLPAGGASGNFLKWSSAGTGKWESLTKAEVTTALGYTPPTTNTTYSAGTGLSLSGNAFSLATSGVTAGSYGPTANVSGSNGTTINVPQITVDTYGRVTSVTNRVYTSVNTDSDTKNTAGSTNSTSKLFLIGATSQAANPQTYSHSSVYETAGVLNANSYTIGAHGTIAYNSGTGCVEISVA